MTAEATWAYSCAQAIATTLEWPSASAWRISGRITSTLRWPLANRTTAMPFARA